MELSNGNKQLLIVGGVVLALVLLSPTSARVVKAQSKKVATKKAPLLPVPISPDPTVKPKTPVVKLRLFTDQKDNRPLSGLYSLHLDQQAERCRQMMYEAGYGRGYLRSFEDWKLAIWKEIPFVGPSYMWKLAQDFLKVCKEENYPLDLAIGHAWAESSCRPAMTMNSAGAIGPLQVTRVAAEQVGEFWPPISAQSAIRIGIKYMKWIRRTYPEARRSVVDCLRIYGMGYGGFQKAMKLGCPGKAQETYSVWQSECGHKAYVYTQRVLEVARNCPELHTVRWDTWTGKE
ncbi:lytic transglycosylase domain-containing protein [Deinococcus cellulosilyticus]|uniref:Transglycosylase SLT domain-containing protein n=1 Tax=Deinococcus cellulosilyticus (strain DSM 18568 / NBRC 106333 / KACC 11606 / 5516J-15) TaxID=1223518 RepID=A0A511MYE2_DEIC1|nr:lytic transglycosylase domain-containing protein [Deinococcus cellulosilyticus]GEM45298.1 hypothetical protein DC3_09330 [Deinococcus cellulosilyticus NBRC 106333 = KACC 11606]